LHRLLLLLWRFFGCIWLCLRLLAAAMALAPLHLFVVASFAAFGWLHRLCCLHRLLLCCWWLPPHLLLLLHRLNCYYCI
jgi:hypothetical protein